MQRREEAEKKQAAVQRENQAGAVRREQDQADRDRLKAAHGAALDALDKGAIRQLIADHFPEDLIELYQKKLSRVEKPAGMLQIELLTVLAQLSEGAAA